MELVGVEDQYTLPPDFDGMVMIRVTGPGMGAINSAVLKLNGKRVEWGDRARETANSMIGIMSGLQPGDNLIQLYADVKASEPVAQLRTSILLLPEMSCASMAGQTIDPAEIGLPTNGATISGTRLVAASVNAAIASRAPEYCELTGFISPADPNSLPINFRVAIPTQWNQKAWQFGGGGTDGSIPGLISPSVSAMLPSNVPRPIALWYATYGGDSGHSGFGSTWIDNPNFPTLSESFQNFTFDSLKKTHDAAVAVMKRMYSKAPAVNYFAGQSQGGREALTVLWRYPLDYDGIMAQDFLAYFANLNFNPQLQGSLQVSDFGGTWVPLTKSAALRSHVIAECDDIDNLHDGIIQNYKGCATLFDPSFNPTVLQGLNCGGNPETANCLTDGQIATLRGPAFLGPVQYSYPLRDNETSYPGWGPLEGLSLLTSTAPVLANGASYTGAGAGGFLGIALVREYFCGSQTGCNVLQIFHDLNAQQQKIQVLSDAVDIDEDWSQFKARGGKAIIDTSAADTISNPLAQFKLLDRVAQKMGQAELDSFVRYYVSPMTGHGGSGNGATVPTAADLTTPMIRWVEELISPPDAPIQMRITTSGSGANTVYTIAQSRPLCRYPMYPHYNGTGFDPLQASSYTCQMP
ncbi:MAG: tannase/feruloyl esterase family alpha/beta hydrolase [Syntrophales bacterium]